MTIKMCPFCGGRAKLVETNWCTDRQFDDDHDEAYVQCKECGAKGGVIHIVNARYRDTCTEELERMRADARIRWNNRV